MVIPTIVGVTLIVFLMIQLIPGSIIEQMLSQMEHQYQESDVQVMREAMGIDVPLHVQFGRWVTGVVRGDLGKSLWSGVPVMDQVMRKLPVSFELGVLSLLISLIVAIPVGVYSAIRQDTVGDYLARSFAILALAVPAFWIATLLMVYPSIWWDWTPQLEYIPFTVDPLRNLGQFIVPSIIIGLAMTGTSMRMTRTMMLESLRQDYIRTAWSKGLRERTVIMRHALKNALIPVVTIIGLQVPILVGGAVLMEQIFNLPGLGRHLVTSIGRRDYIVIAGINLFAATAILIANLVVDVSYAYLDPRIRYR